MLHTPADREDVQTAVVGPVIKLGRPAVEVDQHLAVAHIADGCNAHQRCIVDVHCFDFHARQEHVVLYSSVNQQQQKLFTGQIDKKTWCRAML